MNDKYKKSLFRYVLIMVLIMFTGCTSVELEDETIMESEKAVTEIDMNSLSENQEAENIDNSNENLEKDTVAMMGYYKLEDIELNTPGIYVMYPDGSFSDYYTGSPLSWSATHMTYGIDSYFYDLVMREKWYELNRENLKNGKLVIFCSKEYQEDKLWYNLYPVRENGKAMSNYDETWKVMLLESASSTYNEIPQFASWMRGKSVDYMNTKVKTIDGIAIEDYSFPEFSTERKFVDLSEENRQYTIGIVSGTTIEEKEYIVDCRYFLQEGDDCFYDIKMEPTVDGYATCDFSEIPTGEYILSISWFEENQRHVITTCVSIP